jgi:uncharacterized protein DUF222/HNH endonuclease
MFEQGVTEPCSGCGGDLPVDVDLEQAWERLLADTDLKCPPDPAPEPAPGWLDDQPAGFGSCAPSGFLALDLDSATADPVQLSDHTLIEAMVGFDRLASWAAARQARLLAEFARRRPSDRAPHSARWAGVGSEYAPDEAGVALHLSRPAACARIVLAQRLLSVLPQTHAAWEAGRIDTAKARAVDDATWTLTPELARAVQDRVLPNAPAQTLGQLKAALSRAVIAVDPEGAEARHREARRDRRVVVTPEADGMASLWALLTATQATGAFTWLTRLARGLGADDPRSMDTRRADILAALLTGRPITHPDPDTGDDASGDEPADPGGNAGRPVQPVTPAKPLIQVVIPYSTLTGADDQPCELVGHGPIPASLARDVAADGVWRRLITDPLSGTLLDYGRTTYQPPAGLADFVRARDVYCRAPGCRRKAADGELDHIIAWSDGGTTSEQNLGGYCTHDHRLKHHAGWQVDAEPDGGITWTTPTGHRHTTRPHDYRPDPPSPPDDADLDPPPF